MFGIIIGITLFLCVLSLGISISLTVFMKAPNERTLNHAAFLSLAAIMLFFIALALVIISCMGVIK